MSRWCGCEGCAFVPSNSMNGFTLLPLWGEGGWDRVSVDKLTWKVLCKPGWHLLTSCDYRCEPPCLASTLLYYAGCQEELALLLAIPSTSIPTKSLSWRSAHQCWLWQMRTLKCKWLTFHSAWKSGLRQTYPRLRIRIQERSWGSSTVVEYLPPAYKRP